MKTETLNTKFPVEVNGPVIDSLYSFNLLMRIEKKKQKRAWLNGELHSMVLLNQSDKQILRTTLHSNLNKHS